MTSARTYDLNGWFEVKDNPISREGVFPYSGAQIGAPAEDSHRIFNVLRPAEELSDPETLASFRLVPFIDDHTMIGEGFTAAEDKGVAGVVGEQVRFSDGVMTANLKIYSKTLAQKIKTGKTELSCGYRCVYEFTPGVWNGQQYDAIQRQIRANHLALVTEGRMGHDVRVLDHMSFTVDAKEILPVDEELKEMLASIAARLDKLEAAENKEAPAADETAEEGTQPPPPANDDEPKDPPPAAADAGAAMDALTQEVKALRATVATLQGRPAMDEAAVMDTLAKKGALVDRLKPHIGVFDSSAMTYAAVAAYGLEKLGVKNVPAGQEAIALDAVLQARPAATPLQIAADASENSSLRKDLASWGVGGKK